MWQSLVVALYLQTNLLFCDKQNPEEFRLIDSRMHEDNRNQLSYFSKIRRTLKLSGNNVISEKALTHYIRSRIV